MALEAGAKLGPYEILSPLGAGGMGEVYRAKDSRLKREVAVKVLPDSTARNPEALSRFQREAEAVAALSHPNILAVHDFGTDQGVSYLVMELLTGETLRERLQRSAIPWRKAITIGVGVADGLAAAHEKGIIHRDLKPENLFLTSDGVVKILDFGLARRHQPTSPEARTITLDTKPGTVLGTVNYMSPEQVRGEALDTRTDIFSFGCVLYEMVTGQRAFSADTSPETMSAILNHNPPEPAETGATTRPDLDQVITRCLEKKREQRFHSSDDLAFTLRNIVSGTGTSGVPKKHAFSPVRRIAVVIGGIVIVAVAIAFVVVLSNRSPESSMLRSVASLTSFAGREATASWSPDGSFFAYSHSLAGSMDIFVMSSAGGTPLHIVNSPGDDISPRWAPNNAYTAFISGRGPSATASVYLVPPLGGTVRKLAETGIPCVEWLADAFRALGATPWSQDCNSLLFSRLSSAGSIAVWQVDLASGHEEQLTHPPAGSSDLGASWSPDGAWILFCRREERGSLWIMAARGDEPEPLLRDQFDYYQPAWTPDGHGIVFGSNRSGSRNLWQFDIRTRRSWQLTTGPGQDQDPVVASSGAIAYTQFNHQTDLYLLSIESGAEERLTANTKDNFAARFSPNGRRIAFHSDRGGNLDIWSLDRDTGEQRRLTDHPATDVYPDWSPDGSSLVFVSNRNGDFHLWVVDSDGGQAHRVSDEEVAMQSNHVHYNRAIGPRWSPDGKLIGYLAVRETGQSLWTIKPDGTEATRRLSDVETFDWYLDSTRVIYTRLAGLGAKEMLAANLRTGQEAVLLNTPHAELVVARDGGSVAYCLAQSHVAMDLYTLSLDVPSTPDALPVAVGQPRALTRGDGRWHVHNGGWSPDAKEIVYTRDTDEADIYVIKVASDED